jgi:hypothetical protein
MARRIIAAIVGSLKQEPAEEQVHFHSGTGRPEPCYDRRCPYPRFDAG